MSQGVSLPLGFQAAGHACGIKADPHKLDLALFVSDTPCSAAGVFTQNLVVGAPVKVCRSRLPRKTARGVVINSGNSNACTGDRGIADAEWMTATVAKEVGGTAEDYLVCSTGVIGRFLPKEKIAAGIPLAVEKLGRTAEHLETAARSMMTTDTVPKIVTRKLTSGGKTWTFTGVCKGAAMIAPNMATMLSVIMTDAAISAEETHSLVRHAVDRSFNCISVDGHTSTSDTVLLLANGQAGPVPKELHSQLQSTMDDVAMALAQLIIRDAEGAEHFVTIDVHGLPTREAAFRIAKTVADSALVKTAITGNDPNWGRIVSAAGYAGVPFQEEDCSLTVNEIPLYREGTPVAFDAKQVSDAMATGEVRIVLHFTLGKESVRFWTSDLTAEYVRLNADYTT
jgi:glutamate N-acetyltransferase/amino-acid N-acetyltransferase